MFSTIKYFLIDYPGCPDQDKAFKNIWYCCHQIRKRALRESKLLISVDFSEEKI